MSRQLLDGAVHEEIERMGGTVTFDAADPTLVVGVELPEARVTNDQLLVLKDAPNLETLRLTSPYFNSTQLSGTVLAWLRQQPRLRHLHLHGSAVTDAGLRSAASFPNLRELTLTGASITDEGLRASSALSRLALLRVGGERRGPYFHAFFGHEFSFFSITDIGVRLLESLRNLRSLASMARPLPIPGYRRCARFPSSWISTSAAPPCQTRALPCCEKWSIWRVSASTIPGSRTLRWRR